MKDKIRELAILCLLSPITHHPSLITSFINLSSLTDSVYNGAMKKIRVLIAKPGLDGHDRGAKVIARALSDAGMEVIYTGLRQTPEQIVTAAIQEDVNCIGLSILSGAHNHLFPEILKLLKERNAGDIPVFAGGIIPTEDIPDLKKMGIQAVFQPGTSTDEVLRFVRKVCDL